MCRILLRVVLPLLVVALARGAFSSPPQKPDLRDPQKLLGDLLSYQFYPPVDAPRVLSLEELPRLSPERKTHPEPSRICAVRTASGSQVPLEALIYIRKHFAGIEVVGVYAGDALPMSSEKAFFSSVLTAHPATLRFNVANPEEKRMQTQSNELYFALKDAACDIVVFPEGDGIALATLQAKRAGVGFIDTKLVVIMGEEQVVTPLGDFIDMERDFMQRRSAELADLFVCTPAGVDSRALHGWRLPKGRVISVARPQLGAALLRAHTLPELYPPRIKSDFPMVSVVVATHNRPHYLPEALDSLLAQDYAGELEIIVVDDGSTDPDVAHVLDDISQLPGVRVFRRPHAFPGATRNFGAKQAKGQLLVFMDDDNLAFPDMVSAFAVAQARSGADVVTGSYLTVAQEPDGSLDLYGYWTPLGPAVAVQAIGHCMGDTFMAIRPEAFFRVGGFPIEQGTNEDMELHTWLGVNHATYASIPEPTLRYRTHNHHRHQSITRDTADMYMLRPYQSIMSPSVFSKFSALMDEKYAFPELDPSRSRLIRRRQYAPTYSQGTTRRPTTRRPTYSPPTTRRPTYAPPTTRRPTYAPPTTRRPTYAPPTTRRPTYAPPTTRRPTYAPPTTRSPTRAPTRSPTSRAPTRSPTSRSPTRAPTRSPTSRAPTRSPTSRSPTRAPTRSPTSRAPTRSPTSRSPTRAPTRSPTSRSPTRVPTRSPTRSPTTRSPTPPPGNPTLNPTTANPTRSPTTRSPTSRAPTRSPTTRAPTSRAPTTRAPTRTPTAAPGNPTMPPSTRAPTTRSPTSRTPTTSVPTLPPGNPTLAPSTASPTSRAPTRAPTTVGPTRAPTTLAPTRAPTHAPTTLAPTTLAPTTSAPTTLAPTTAAPTTLAPTTAAPTTAAPTTQSPTPALGAGPNATYAPTTLAPTTQAPTTAAPTTPAPTSLAPTTHAPTTAAPTTLAPTSLAPTLGAGETNAPTTLRPTTRRPTSSPTTPALDVFLCQGVVGVQCSTAAPGNSSTDSSGTTSPSREDPQIKVTQDTIVYADVVVADVTLTVGTQASLNVTGNFSVTDTLVLQGTGTVDVKTGCATFASSSTLVLEVDNQGEVGDVVTFNPVTYQCHSGVFGDIRTAYSGQSNTDPCKSLVPDAPTYGDTGMSVSVRVVDTCQGVSPGGIAAIIVVLVLLVVLGIGGLLLYRRLQDKKAEEAALGQSSNKAFQPVEMQPPERPQRNFAQPATPPAPSGAAPPAPVRPPRGKARPLPSLPT